MIILVFLVALLTSILSYLLISRRMTRKERSIALKRLAGENPAKKHVRGSQPPVLIQMADEVRGRLAMYLLERLRLKQAARRWLETAGLKWGAAGLTHRSVAFFLAGFLVVTIPTRNTSPNVALLAGAISGSLPLVYVRKKGARRIRKFEEQFPDCLEFISRSMRAGHAFSVALEMVHHEFPEPLSGEFRRTFEEQNLGQPLEIVLQKLGQRIPSMDVQFFISAVLLQKRTGGNLAELLDKLAHIIRERFKLRGRIRALSAQGLMSGRILAAIPAGVGVLMFMVNPSYARFFIDDPVGHELLAGALAIQFIGYLIIRKIVTIEV
ncbi:MAG: pilus assembly protein TadB [Terriglobia bacterium]|nr:MAG: pilus assembly protein TadB [Terriglobia bacterium]